MQVRYLVLLSMIIPFFVAAAPGQGTTSIGGYGELHFNKPDGSSGTLDFHRFVIFLSHAFNDKLSFKSELELEHTRIEAGEDEGGEIALEQAYLDWRFDEVIGLRAGILLPPVGIINEMHEPSTFNGVERPAVDRTVIPTTWRESGAGIYGSLSEGLKYQLYLMAGLKSEGFSGSSGIRGGRQKAFESSAANPSLTGQIEYSPTTSLGISGSFFAGNTTDGVDSLGGGMLTLFALAAQYADGPISFRGVGVYTSIADAEKINAAFGKGVADNIYGFYLEGAYDIAPFIDPETEYRLDAFARIEKYDTHAQVSGFTANPAYDRTDITTGLSFKPTYNTVFKADYQWFRTASDITTGQFNLGIGYNF